MFDFSLTRPKSSQKTVSYPTVTAIFISCAAQCIFFYPSRLISTMFGDFSICFCLVKNKTCCPSSLKSLSDTFFFFFYKCSCLSTGLPWRIGAVWEWSYLEQIALYRWMNEKGFNQNRQLHDLCCRFVMVLKPARARSLKHRQCAEIFPQVALVFVLIWPHTSENVLLAVMKMFSKVNIPRKDNSKPAQGL